MTSIIALIVITLLSLLAVRIGSTDSQTPARQTWSAGHEPGVPSQLTMPESAAGLGAGGASRSSPQPASSVSPSSSSAAGWG